MSAHLCTHADINVMVDFTRSVPPRDSFSLPIPPAHYAAASELDYSTLGRGFDPREHPTMFGRALIVANMESLEARYPGRFSELFGNGQQAVTYLARRHGFLYGVTPGKACEHLGFVLKQLDHYDYQACEVADYRDTWAGRAVDQLRSAAIRKLPGYSQAPWGVAFA